MSFLRERNFALCLIDVPLHFVITPRQTRSTWSRNLTLA